MPIASRALLVYNRTCRRRVNARCVQSSTIDEGEWDRRDGEIDYMSTCGEGVRGVRRLRERREQIGIGRSGATDTRQSGADPGRARGRGPVACARCGAVRIRADADATRRKIGATIIVYVTWVREYYEIPARNV